MQWTITQWMHFHKEYIHAAWLIKCCKVILGVLCVKRELLIFQSCDIEWHQNILKGILEIIINVFIITNKYCGEPRQLKTQRLNISINREKIPYLQSKELDRTSQTHVWIHIHSQNLMWAQKFITFVVKMQISCLKYLWPLSSCSMEAFPFKLD